MLLPPANPANSRTSAVERCSIARRYGLIWVLVCAAISIVWGTAIGRGGNAWIDFRAVYAGTRCLMHGHNPYNVQELTREYASEDGQRPPDSLSYLQAVTLYVNLPTTFILVAPFAALAWGPAHALWMVVTGIAFFLGLLLMWNEGAHYAPGLATFLACIIAVNCESIFAAGNTAGIVVGLCGIAVWCFVKERFVWAGAVCFALSLALKPHDAGMLWLYFLLVGGVYRRRALQSLLITIAIGVAAAGWISHVAPHWMQDWNANLATIAAPGGINDPALNSFSGRSVYMVVDLQAALSIFRNDPHFYNAVSYMVCGTLLLVWVMKSVRTRFSARNAWLALPAAFALSVLITYHRPWDAKLVMCAIPACCLLWKERGRTARWALTITAAATLFAGEVPLSTFKTIADALRLDAHAASGKLFIALLNRPESIALLAMGIFYLLVYVRCSAVPQEETCRASEPEMAAC